MEEIQGKIKYCLFHSHLSLLVSNFLYLPIQILQISEWNAYAEDMLVLQKVETCWQVTLGLFHSPTEITRGGSLRGSAYIHNSCTNHISCFYRIFFFQERVLELTKRVPCFSEVEQWSFSLWICGHMPWGTEEMLLPKGRSDFIACSIFESPPFFPFQPKNWNPTFPFPRFGLHFISPC